MTDYKKSRKLGKAATLPSAPAWTFRGKRDKVPDDPGPGPGQYDASLDYSPRGANFGSSTRYINPGTSTPSPLDYKASSRATLKSAPAYSFGGKQVPDHLKSKTPGPGHYDQHEGMKQTKRGQPAITMSARCVSDKEAERKPAPNAYSPDYNPKDTPAASLKFRHASPGARDVSPGPLDYADMHFRRPASEGKTFGTSRGHADLDNGIPGPAMYCADDKAVRSSRNAWSVPRSVRDPNRDNGVPGPGNYLHSPLLDHSAGHGIKSHNRSAPAYTFPGKPYYMRDPATPGPGEYGLPNDPMRKSSAAFTFHGVNAKDPKAKLPGPGAYEPGAAKDSVRTSAPAYSIAFKPDDPALKEKRPGPNEYTLPTESKPGVSIKFRHSFSSADPGPGPLEYADKDFRKIYCPGGSKKGFSFGLKPRPKMRDPVPGPIYQIGCTTLGIAAAQPMTQTEMQQVAVL
mmetsp:Transcript_9241/g.19760  ORF Transcript_9241/g.19760 Transcript_9241/m.19760 type:complete len:457 (-) Transcript_9241:679-2049(-)|eukprot:CAMPEP_0202893612 /NCGR_PEP_ID=MMETSP1392-20130828/3167_1 /ASSEMBLY_ACC=CAM_ASM_000868 /TAXON_ID=225041 /ORGANISM="Chlamydomonas chlamydogama, Strain SAG 11-48b" /LENGTH=456 /DNA_ID=CAMNT_0049578009 /DNA_START=11 /DNA_END=1381 /DNA_ORIENTATION=-